MLLAAVEAGAAPGTAATEPEAVDATAPATEPELVVDEASPLVVSATATPERPERTGRVIAVTDREQIVEEAPRNTPEALEGLPGVTLQQTSPAGGAPFLRGLVGPQVLLLVDGVRLNNSIWRSGPLPYLNLIGVDALQAIEVLRGPAPVLYGSDALGGVVHLRTREPTFVAEGFDLDGGLAVAYRSAADTKQLRAEIDSGGRDLAVRLGGDLADFGNLRGGRDTGAQDFTSYRQGGVDAKVAYTPRPGHALSLSYLGGRQIDAPRPDRCVRYEAGHVRDCRQTKELFLDLLALRYASQAGSFFDDVGATLSLQNFHELTERLRWDRGHLLTKQDDVLVLGGRFHLSHPFSRLGPAALRTTLGGELYRDQVESEAWDKSIRGHHSLRFDSLGEPDPLGSTVADGAAYTTAGLFLEQRLLLFDALSLVGGLRYSAYYAEAPTQERLDDQSLGRGFAAPAASLFGEYQLPIPLSLGAGLVHGFRAPNLYDLTGRDHFGGGYELADPTRLGPERITSGELVARGQMGPLSAELAGYASLLHELIVRQPGSYQGYETYDREQVFVRVNSGAAYLLGAEAAARLQLPARTELYATYAYTFGQDLSHDEPLSRVPPPGGSLGIRSAAIEDLSLGAYARWALAQERLSARDVADARIAEGGTPGYFVLGLRASYVVLRQLRIGAGLHNLFDSSYRVHGSGFDGPGVEGRVRLDLTF